MGGGGAAGFEAVTGFVVAVDVVEGCGGAAIVLEVDAAEEVAAEFDGELKGMAWKLEAFVKPGLGGRLDGVDMVAVMLKSNDAGNVLEFRVPDSRWICCLSANQMHA